MVTIDIITMTTMAAAKCMAGNNFSPLHQLNDRWRPFPSFCFLKSGSDYRFNYLNLIFRLDQRFIGQDENNREEEIMRLKKKRPDKEDDSIYEVHV